MTPEQLSDREQTLTAYARQFGTDKVDHHSYMGPYAQCLPDKCRSMLEIGVAKGASAKLWDAFYGKEELDLFLFDLYKDPDHVSPRWVRNSGWTPIVGDQSDINDLAAIKEVFQVIIDDGSHRADHMLVSFKHLFANNCQGGGLYVIEDVACNKNSFYNGGLVEKFEDTPLWMFKNYLTTGRIISPYFNSGDELMFQSLIKEVKIFDEEIIFIFRN